MPSANAQLQTLSRGNTDAQWRSAQIEIFEKQLADKATPESLRLELNAQRDWLARWNPSAIPGPTSSKSEPSNADRRPPTVNLSATLKEPILDPSGKAKEFRAALFNPKKRPSTEDTNALQAALTEHSADIGLRQLQMHWLDQPRYRDEYWKEISQACDRVAALIAEEKPSEEGKAAAAHAYYRKARALAHGLRGAKVGAAKVAGAKELKEEDLQLLRDTIGDCGSKIENLVGLAYPEFFQLEIYLLRRDGWSGRALEVLEKNASTLDQSAYLAERRSILAALKWAKPEAQTIAQLSALGGDLRLLEIQFD